MFKIQTLIQRYQEIFDHRDERLFSEFLVTGYQETTLSSVPTTHREEVVYVKFCLGMIITIYDDLADNPSFYSPKLLKDLYRLNLEDVYYPVELNSIHELVQHLFREMRETLARFPRYLEYREILNFDIRHIFLANQYSELMTSYSFIRNQSEGKALGPYNMGMVAAGMIDLMASPIIVTSELGPLREVFISGQRIGRIGNLISTFEREKNEGDLTNEMSFHPEGEEAARIEILRELKTRLSSLRALDMKSINIHRYADSLDGLFRLHERMEGII